jgi:hypothetical protein
MPVPVPGLEKSLFVDAALYDFTDEVKCILKWSATVSLAEELCVRAV